MITITYRDELVYAGTGGGSNRHRPALDLEKDGVFHEFKGASIPGICRVVRDEYKKNGKWSYTTWTLQLAEGVHAWTNAGGRLADLGGLCTLTAPLTLAATWADVPEPLHRVVRGAYPRTTQRLDEADKPILDRPGVKVWGPSRSRGMTNIDVWQKAPSNEERNLVCTSLRDQAREYLILATAASAEAESLRSRSLWSDRGRQALAVGVAVGVAFLSVYNSAYFMVAMMAWVFWPSNKTEDRVGHLEETAEEAHAGVRTYLGAARKAALAPTLRALQEAAEVDEPSIETLPTQSSLEKARLSLLAESPELLAPREIPQLPG